MFIEREMAETLRVVMNEYPIVTISGSRQSGKTTLAKKCLPEYGYVNLEDADSAEFARSDPKGFLRQYSPPLIIDEAQRVPELMSSLRLCTTEMTILKDKESNGSISGDSCCDGYD